VAPAPLLLALTVFGVKRNRPPAEIESAVLSKLISLLDFTGRRRRRIRARPFPDEWRRIVRRAVPYCKLLTPEEQHELEGHVQVLLEEKHFEGAGGLEMTDEVRLSIAAQAALLLLNRGEPDYYPGLSSIIVYPASYVAPAKQQRPDGTIVEGPQARSGESWLRGNVVLSWRDVRHGAGDEGDGRNVVIHEFAHQLDGATGETNGAPPMPSAEASREWSRVLAREFDELRAQLRHTPRTFLGRYAATSPAEFFAVATEKFFEEPIELRERHRDLYEQLKSYFRQDAAERFETWRRKRPTTTTTTPQTS